MSEDERETDRGLVAAEYVLRLLDGPAHVDARLRLSRDPEFADDVARWEERLAPLLDEIPAEKPGREVWTRIHRALITEQAPGSNVAVLERRVRFWRAASIGVGAMAASLALILGYQAMNETPAIIQPQTQPIPPIQPVLIAGLASEETDTSLSVTFSGSSLVVAPVRLARVTGKDHQLWIIPEGGVPISLGLIAGEAPQRLRLPEALAGQFRPAATIALSREPLGGSPTGQPTGPVVAAGALTSI